MPEHRLLEPELLCLMLWCAMKFPIGQPAQRQQNIRYKIQDRWKVGQSILIMMRLTIWTLLVATSVVLACKPSDPSLKVEDINEPSRLTLDEEKGAFKNNFGKIYLYHYTSRSFLRECGDVKQGD